VRATVWNWPVRDLRGVDRNGRCPSEAAAHRPEKVIEGELRAAGGTAKRGPSSDPTELASTIEEMRAALAARR
jgi:hypothetical protein